MRLLLLLRNEVVLRSRLHDLFLDLVIDYDQQVAFTRQVVAEELDAPILLRKMKLTFLESALLLFLRQRLTSADAQGERGVASLQEMQDYLNVFEREDNADEAKFERQVQIAVEKLRKLSLIRMLVGADKRFEVAPTLKLLFPAEEIQALTRTYAGLVAKQTGQNDQGDVRPSENGIEADDIVDEDDL